VSPIASLRLRRSRCLLALPHLGGCGSDDPVQEQPPVDDGPLPTELPFELTRPSVGTPPSAAETAAFTAKINRPLEADRLLPLGLLAQPWPPRLYDPAMPTTPSGADTVAVKAGDTVTFRHQGGADNLMIRTSMVLNQAIAGYLASGDAGMRRLVIDYSKGIVALFQGWCGTTRPETESIMARAIFTHNHGYTTEDGRQVSVGLRPHEAGGEVRLECAHRAQPE